MLKNGLGKMYKRRWEAILEVTLYKTSNRAREILPFKADIVLTMKK